MNGEEPHSRPVNWSRLESVKRSQRVLLKTREALSKHAKRLADKATEHENLINKITYCVGVVSFGLFCYLLGSKPQDIPYLYCAFFVVAAPLRWLYYRSKKWHYFLLDFCYYANIILVVHVLFFPRNKKLFLLCFAFAEGPLAWALIVWRCSLVFSSVDKTVSVIIHSMPGTVLFVLRWWSPEKYPGLSHWPNLSPDFPLLLWMLAVPLAVYGLWQLAYWLVVEVLRKQRLLTDPQVLTSFRELSRKAARANNLWWRLSGVMGHNNRVLMYMLLQGLFTVATIALTIPMLGSYKLHSFFQFFKVAASIWNGGNFFLEVMPRQALTRINTETKRQGKQEAVNGDTPTAAGSSLASSQGQLALNDTEPEPAMVSHCERCRRLSASDLPAFFDSSELMDFRGLRSKSYGSFPETANGASEADAVEFDDEYADAEYDLLSGTEFRSVDEKSD